MPLAPSAAAPTRSLWIVRPSVDLVIGCGGWSLPLLAIAYGLSGDAARSWSVSFYSLALLVNYPHYMATVYRAYGRGHWRRHVPFTVWATVALSAAGAVAHIQTALVPALFTAYVMWSPWHYSGQNYGLTMMFLKRGGYDVGRTEQRWLKAAFAASYVMLLASFNNGPSADPLVWSAALSPASARVIGNVALVIFLAGCAPIIVRLLKRRGEAIAPPLTLLTTQALWFAAPAAVSIFTAAAAPQTRYSSGVLALMHSAQYLWITQHFAKREQAGEWSGRRYWLAVIAGGIALFLPVPWLASTIAHLDFTTSMLIVTAVVNLHHFMIDGVVWKLRDARVAAALTTDGDAGTAASAVTSRRGHRAVVAIAAILLAALAGIDQWRYRLASRDTDAASLQQALAINPYDAPAQSRLLSTLIESQRYDEARTQLDTLIAAQPQNTEAHVNAGVLARQTGRVDDAITHWAMALARNPDQPQVHLYVAEAMHEIGRAADAVPHYRAYLESVARDPAARQQGAVVAAVILKFGDALDVSGQREAARTQFDLAARIAGQTGATETATQARQRLERQ